MKNTFTKENKYVVNKKLEHAEMTSVSENFLVEYEWFFWGQNKIYPFLAQGICIYVGHSFL
jgi:hypothetical protein